MKGIECAFTGRLGKDAQLRRSASGREWLSLSVIVGEDEDAQWVSVGSWSHTIADLAPQLTKGTEVYIEGKLRLRSWQGDDGATKSGLSVQASNVQPLALIGLKKPKKARAAKAAPVQTSAAVNAPLPFNDPIGF